MSNKFCYSALDRVTWLILAGGMGSRMHGKDKGLLKRSGRYMTDYLVQQLHELGFRHCLISANRNIAIHQQFAPVITDQYQGYQGPLAGIHAASARICTPYLATLPCDIPELPLPFIQQVIERVCLSTSEDAMSYIAFDGERLQPTFGLLHQSDTLILKTMLNNNERKMTSFFSRINATRLPPLPKQCFVNLNSPSDLLIYNDIIEK
ncbi:MULTISPECIES: molybdenum cofactor guanylyltransferase [unclassified Vibrio]|uniref:Molybdenum cofactor guanylyltransferase n=1 Tax=Vibrio sp. HB236076 TaxID=3232307 RepID=A0AB39H7M0_9VIBR|nr:molybdenum cofactor guanylyltransferase [Vibrio sp. HB161653]MDP5253416.1 molybdenum cofactor guanylyltransferase [Vibrio sp. HB161653]